MIVEAVEYTGGAAAYLGIGAGFARTQSVRCWKAARRRYHQTPNQEQGWRELIALRVLFWWAYLPGRAILRACEKPVAAAQAELAETKASLAEWTDTEKFAIDSTGEKIARMEVDRLKKRVLELEA